MGFITPPEGWGERQSVIPTQQRLEPSPPFQQSPQPIFVYAPQPVPQQISVTVVNESDSGCLWVAFLLLFPLWPITIPIAILVWAAKRASRY